MPFIYVAIRLTWLVELFKFIIMTLNLKFLSTKFGQVYIWSINNNIKIIISQMQFHLDTYSQPLRFIYSLNKTLGHIIDHNTNKITWYTLPNEYCLVN
jgi:hypothetical protein